MQCEIFQESDCQVLEGQINAWLEEVGDSIEIESKDVIVTKASVGVVTTIVIWYYELEDE